MFFGDVEIVLLVRMVTLMGHFALLCNTDMRVSLVILMGVRRKQGSVFFFIAQYRYGRFFLYWAP